MNNNANIELLISKQYRDTRCDKKKCKYFGHREGFIKYKDRDDRDSDVIKWQGRVGNRKREFFDNKEPQDRAKEVETKRQEERDIRKELLKDTKPKRELCPLSLILHHRLTDGANENPNRK